MPRPCSICVHPKRKEIEKAVLERKTGYRLLARRFDISKEALYRHSRNHLPALLAKALAAKPHPVYRPTVQDPATNAYALEIAEHQQAVEAREERHVIDVMAQLKAINAACLEVLRKARAAEKHSTLLHAVDRIHRQIELQARLLGEIQEAQTTVNVAVMPEWHELRQVVLEALQPFPEARLAVVRALKGD